MKARYLSVLGEIESMMCQLNIAIEDASKADELGVTTIQASYLAEALEDAFNAMEDGADDAGILNTEE